MAIKQIICMRRDLNMRKGKMVAQGSHASLGAFHVAMNSMGRDPSGRNVDPDSVPVQWFNGLQKKICVGVDSESQLKLVYENAKLAGLPCYLVLDQGLTEFSGPTYTTCAIGPAEDHHVDAITGNLKLL